MLENITAGAVKAAMKVAGAGSADLWIVPIAEIHELDGFNVRTMNDEYAAHIANIGESILANGFMRDKPLTVFVRRIGDKDINCLVDGYSRLAGARYAIERGAEITTLPVVTKPSGTNIEDLTVGLVVSNSGKPLTPIEKAAVCKRLVGYGMDEDAIAKRLGFTKIYVKDLLMLIGATKEIRSQVESGSISAANATQAIKKHGDKAAEVIKTSVDTAKAAGKKKATKAVIEPKQKMVDVGVAWIKTQEIRKESNLEVISYLSGLLAKLSGVTEDTVREKLNAAA